LAENFSKTGKNIVSRKSVQPDFKNFSSFCHFHPAGSGISSFISEYCNQLININKKLSVSNYLASDVSSGSVQAEKLRTPNFIMGEEPDTIYRSKIQQIRNNNIKSFIILDRTDRF